LIATREAERHHAPIPHPHYQQRDIITFRLDE